MAGPIWVNTMSEALRGRRDVKFTVPSGVVRRSVCYNGGLAPRGGYGTYTESFLAWNLPTKTCTPEKSPEELEQERKNKEAEEKKKAEEEKKKQEEETPPEDETTPGTGDEEPNPDDETGSGNNGGGTGPIVPPITP